VPSERGPRVRRAPRDPGCPGEVLREKGADIGLDVLEAEGAEELPRPGVAELEDGEQSARHGPEERQQVLLRPRQREGRGTILRGEAGHPDERLDLFLAQDARVPLRAVFWHRGPSSHRPGAAASVSDGVGIIASWRL